ESPCIDSKPFGNDAHTGSPRSRQGLTDSFFECGGNWGPPEALSVGVRRQVGEIVFLLSRHPVFADEPSLVPWQMLLTLFPGDACTSLLSASTAVGALR